MVCIVPFVKRHPGYAPHPAPRLPDVCATRTRNPYVSGKTLLLVSRNGDDLSGPLHECFSFSLDLR